jgi:hypothetical protein
VCKQAAQVPVIFDPPCKLTGRTHLLPQFTALVEEDCNINKKYLIKKNLTLLLAFSLGFLQAGPFDSSCLYNPASDREVDVKNLGRLPNTLPNYCAGFLSRPKVNSGRVHSDRNIKTASCQILNY